MPASSLRLRSSPAGFGVILAVSASLLTGCGSTTANKTVPAARTQNLAGTVSFIRDADAVCRQMAWQNRRFRILPSTTDKAGDALLARYTEARSRSVRRLRHLTPPASIRKRFRSYVQVLTDDLAAGRLVLAMDRAHSLPGMLAAGKQHASFIREASAIAHALGLRTCAGLK